MAGEAALQLNFLMKPLAMWLDDPTTEEICINSPGELFVRQLGQFRREPAPFDYFDLEVHCANRMSARATRFARPSCPVANDCKYACHPQSRPGRSA
jgi:type IV secretory pathway ATPase VirB11/archaellum biosynthesis ATPase